MLRVSLVLVGATLLLSGCEPSIPKTYEVKGKVTFDGKPLNEGTITFELNDGRAPATLQIKNGSYEGQSRAGNSIVRITADKMMPATNSMSAEPTTEKKMVPVNYLPERYNHASELRAVVKPEGPNEFSFDLRHQPPSTMSNMK